VSPVNQPQAEEEEEDTPEIASMDTASQQEAAQMNKVLAMKFAQLENEKAALAKERKTVEQEKIEARAMHDHAEKELKNAEKSSGNTAVKDLVQSEQVLLAKGDDSTPTADELGGLLQLSARRINRLSSSNEPLIKGDASTPSADELGGLLQLSARRISHAPGAKAKDIDGAASLLQFSIDDLPEDHTLGYIEDTSQDVQLKKQILASQKVKEANFNATAKAIADEEKARRRFEATPQVKHVDRSGRNVELNKLDEHDSRTQPGGPLWGAQYNAMYVPTGIKKDSDGKCRDSRGEIASCDGIPDGFAPGGNFGDDTYPLDDLGACILKCIYHMGPHRTHDKGATGSFYGNTDVVSINVPTDSDTRATYGCPRTNKGFPFMGCSLEQNNDPKCKATCVYDGSANPLKPRPNPQSNGDQPQGVNPKSFAHSTYEKVVTHGNVAGCTSSSRADPLVYCEVKL
jgi:hypothetical protein